MNKDNLTSCRNILKTHPPKLKINVLTINLQAGRDRYILGTRISRLVKEQKQKLSLTIFSWIDMVIAPHSTVTTKDITSLEFIKIFPKKTYRQNYQEIIVFTKKRDSSIATLKKIPGFKQTFAQSNYLQRWTILCQQDINSVLTTAYTTKLIAEELLLFILANLASGKCFLQLAFVHRIASNATFLSFIKLSLGNTKANPYSPVL